MKTVFLFFFAAGIFLFSCKKSSESAARLDLIYEVLSRPDLQLVTHEDVILSEQNTLFPPSFPREYSSEVNYLASILNESDTTFLKKQLEKRTEFTTEELRDRGVKVVHVEEASYEFFESQQIDGFYSTSMPVFNKEFTKAYLRIGYICGPLCGGGQEVVLEKENEQWRIHKELGVWVN